MLFQDQAQQLLARWETLREADELENVAIQTAVALAVMPEVPESVLNALDALLSYRAGRRAKWTLEVVRYLRTLATAKLRITID